jgi:hypothetical protein
VTHLRQGYGGQAFAGAGAADRPPLWLVIATGAMAVVLLAMSVGETSFKGQYLIDQGEYLSLVGLVFILGAGLYLHRRGRLVASMPLVFPWLLYPVITQGDQIIDNLSITWMRIIVHVLLAAIFAMPVAVVVFAARGLFKLSPVAARNLTIALLVAEFWLAYQFLGALMIATLVIMIVIVWYAGSRRPSNDAQSHGRKSAAALVMLIVGGVLSGGLYLGFKNRPGAYQGSPSYYMDATQASGFQSTINVPAGAVAVPVNADDVKMALTTYADCLQKLLDGYYILDRNYNYHFHNELFVRNTPLLPNYRSAGLSEIEHARQLRAAADAAADRVNLSSDTPLGAVLADVRAYVAFNFDRAATLERMSAEFETTKAGLQHATHIYEGEGKYLGLQLADLLNKHQAALRSPAAAPLAADFVTKSRAIHERYSNRIVGF